MSSLTNPDIRVKLIPIPAPISVFYDWLQDADGMLDQAWAMATAVAVALGTDGQASPSDELPQLGDANLRGWWGDLDAATIWQGWPVGSRLWLLARAKITGVAAKQGSTLTTIQTYIREALQPFVTAGICSRFTISVQQTEPYTVVARIRIYRGPLPDIELQYQSLWDFIQTTSAPLG